MKKCNCPQCGRELIRLEPYEKGISKFWCDECDLDISITSVYIVCLEDNINGKCTRYSELADSQPL